jgi:glycosyltransferase EpsE
VELKKNDNLKITVLCTVYNGERYFDRAIPSILNQTYGYFDFLIINDGSNDNTLIKLLEIQRLDSRVKIVDAGRLGRVKALNYGISIAETELIAIQDFDDISYPTRLENQVKFMVSNPEVCWLGTAGKNVNLNRNEEKINVFPIGHNEIVRTMAHSIPYDHTTVMFRKNAVIEAGGYEDTFGAGVEDFLLSIKVAMKGYKFANLEKVLGEHMEHPESFWNNNHSYMERQRKIQKVQIYAIRELKLPFWMYVYPFGRYFYGYLPNWLKRAVRILIGKKEL